MGKSIKAGTALRSLCLPATLAMVTACGHQSQSQAGSRAQKPNEAQELFQVVEATRNNPSLQPGSNQAGPPINVNPYPKPPAKAHAEHGDHTVPKH